ncbi:TPA: hypothetical protein ACNEZT_004234 [Escherichia coli]
MYRLVTVSDSFLGFCANCKEHHPDTKAPPYRYCSGTTSSKETQESKTMKNRKAKMLISRVYRRCYPSQWLRVSNRRVVLYLYSGIAREGVKEKRSAAQNRWKKHLRTKGA